MEPVWGYEAEETRRSLFLLGVGVSDYMGRDSCLARREGVYVRRLRRPGIDTFKEAVGIAALVLRDYRRGYGYEDRAGCGRISFTRELAEKKLRYIIPLSVRHGASDRVLEKIEKLVGYAVKHKKLPAKYKDYAREIIAGYEKIEDELEEVFTKPKKRVKVVKPKKPRGSVKKKALSKGGKVGKKRKGFKPLTKAEWRKIYNECGGTPKEKPDCWSRKLKRRRG